MIFCIEFRLGIINFDINPSDVGQFASKSDMMMIRFAFAFAPVQTRSGPKKEHRRYYEEK